jgi:translation initiation factor IF-2
MVTEGKITRGASVRLTRDHVVVYQGKVASLRRFKDDVREVTAGYECGVGLENFQDVKIGDVLEVFAVEQVARRLHAKPQEAEVRLSA